MVNSQSLQGNWNELRGQVKKVWGQLTDSDLDQFKGNVQELVGTIQKKTGQAKETIERELNDIANRGASTAGRATEAVQHAASQAGERIHEGYDYAATKVQDGYAQAEDLVKQRPAESIAVAFSSGLIAGVILGLVLRR